MSGRCTKSHVKGNAEEEGSSMGEAPKTVKQQEKHRRIHAISILLLRKISTPRTNMCALGSDIGFGVDCTQHTCGTEFKVPKSDMAQK